MSDRPDRITVRFSVLGPVSIDDGTQTVILPSAKPVSLLAAMLLRPNRVVPVDYVRNAVWGQNAADTTKATLQAYILRLRKIFRKFGADDDIIQIVPGGYRLPVTPATLDLAARELTASAGAAEQPETELRHLRRALALWQGGRWPTSSPRPCTATRCRCWRRSGSAPPSAASTSSWAWATTATSSPTCARPPAPTRRANASASS